MKEIVNNEAEKNRRNQHGVKDASKCYRTINGDKYVAWTSFPSQGEIKAYRMAGVRCRRLGVELFVHVFDVEKAADVDANFPS